MITLSYGNTTQSARAPESWNIVPLTIGQPLEGASSERDIVLSALDAPIASPKLEAFLSPRDTVAVILSDKTRKCRTEFFLPYLLDIVHAAGIPREAVTLVFANGTHPRMSEHEIDGIIGEQIRRGYRIVENQAKDGGHVLVGTTRFGTPVELLPDIVNADKVIAAGTIVHHYFAGYGGGAKLFMPGSASYLSATTNHRRTLTSDGSFHSGCRDGFFEGNPVAEDIWDAVRFFPPTFYFGTILGEDGLISAAVCGDLVEAHTAGCSIVDSLYTAPIAEKADCVIVSPGGFPKDINLIQTHKSLHHASYAVKDGGTIILLAECRDGIGNPSFMQWFEYADETEMKKAVLERYAMNAHTAITLREKCRRFRMYYAGALRSEDVEAIGMIPAPDLQSALTTAANHLPASPLVYTIDNGFLLVPKTGG